MVGPNYSFSLRAGGPRLQDSLKSVLVLGTGETLKRNTLPVFAPPKPNRSSSYRDTYIEGDDVEVASSEQVTSEKTKHNENIALKNQPDEPPSKGQPDEPPSKGQPGEPPSKGQPNEPPSKGQPGEPPSKGQPGEPPSKGQPGEPPSKGQPGEPPSKGQPDEPPSKGQPGEPPSKDQPCSTSSPDTSVHVYKDSNGVKDKDVNGVKDQDVIGVKDKDDKAIVGVVSNGTEQVNEPSEIDLVEKDGCSSSNKNKETDAHPDNTTSQQATNSCSKDQVANGHSEKDDVIESTEPKSKPAPEPDDHGSAGGGYDYVFEASRSLGKVLEDMWSVYCLYSLAGVLHTCTHTHSCVHVHVNTCTCKHMHTARIRQNRESQSEETPRRSVESQEEYRPPPNPYLRDDSEDLKEETPEPPSPTAKWLGEDTMFVDCFGEGVGREKLDRAELIAVSMFHMYVHVECVLYEHTVCIV